MTTAKEVYDIAEELLKKQSRKQLTGCVGEWNELLCFLNDKVREEKAKESA